MMVSNAHIVDPVVLIRVPQAYRPGMSGVDLYEVTRGVWKIGPRRDKAEYALAVYDGIVREAYQIECWQPAWTTPYRTRKFENVKVPGRWEFVGSVAPETVRARYVGKSVRDRFSFGSRNPIMYVNVPWRLAD